jgi:hypothetical protein
MRKIKDLFRLSRAYVVWNEEKVGQHTPLKADSLIGLVDAESRTNSSISSHIVTKDIEEVIEGVYNEADVRLCYAPKFSKK